MQPELTAAAAEGKGTDPFARARARFPNDRLILTLDHRDGVKTMMRVPPEASWHPLLPPEQIVEIHAPDGQRPGE